MTEHLLAPYTPSDGTDVARRISNSEVATWLTCEKKYYYEFDLNLEPNVSSGALGKGTLLHEILAEYYEHRKVNTSHNNAVSAARNILMGYMNGSEYSYDTVIEVDRLLLGYWNWYKGDDNWEILEVEKSYDLPITDEYEYSLRLDLLVRERDTGLIVLVDHKTAYDFWDQDKLDMSPQFPKYIAALRANGVMVDKAVLNQIRSRKIKAPTNEQLFQRTPCVPSQAKIENLMREQVLASQDIIKHRNLPVEAQSMTTKRLLNSQVCNWCNVKPLCLAELEGENITDITLSSFKQRTYGYNAAATDNGMSDL